MSTLPCFLSNSETEDKVHDLMSTPSTSIPPRNMAGNVSSPTMPIFLSNFQAPTPRLSSVIYHLSSNNTLLLSHSLQLLLRRNRRLSLWRSSISQDPSDLDNTHATKEEVDSCQAVILLALALSPLPRNTLVVGDQRTVTGLGDYTKWGRGRGDVQNVLRLNDQAPTSPDRTGSGQGCVLSEGKRLGWAPEIGDTREDECPLCVC